MKSLLGYSAAMPKEVAKISKSFLTNPIEITVGNKNVGAENIEHVFTMFLRESIQSRQRIRL